MGLVTPELGPAQPECSEGYYYHEKYEHCIERDPDGCMNGYYFDREKKRCVPTNGPNSPCPPGSVYDPRTECCVPEPGLDSTRCPEDEENPIGTPDLTQGFQPFAATNFDPNSGECEDDDSTRNPGEPEDCPPSLLATAISNCDQYPLDWDPQIYPVLQQANCPEEYWNLETNTCEYPEPECGEKEYFNRRLGYCVLLRDDCCEIGQDYSAFYKECVDVVTKPRNGECPDGFELIDGLCWLIGRTEGQGGMCWTITRNTPRCVGPCEVGQHYNEATGKCEEPPEPEEQPKPEDPCANINCSNHKPPNCPSNCCKDGAAGYGCVPK